ncbi:hypothetical protein B0T11DRAFT_16992 [Plectosphaerella cucumerina]|uniref:Uncharacterized protein n=1 Tax=Plectosphaerella cucumerina TaxID=40658 RepID=A0A8K0TPM6_9PEZI|nr:hypothetical protein B0T11DRAFT_16992 [Plectosphaerella cucumerina]
MGMGRDTGPGASRPGEAKQKPAMVLIKSIVGASHHRALSFFCSPRLVPRSSSRAHIISSPARIHNSKRLSPSSSPRQPVKSTFNKTTARSIQPSTTQLAPVSHQLAPSLPHPVSPRRSSPTNVGKTRKSSIRPTARPIASSLPRRQPRFSQTRPGILLQSPPSLIPLPVSPTLASSRLASLFSTTCTLSSPAPRTTHHTTYTTGLPPHCACA